MLCKDRIQLGHGDGGRGRNFETHQRAVLIQIGADAMASVEGSGHTRLWGSRQVQVGREGLALSESDLEISALHGCTPKAVTTTKRCSNSSGSTTASHAPPRKRVSMTKRCPAGVVVELEVLVGSFTDNAHEPFIERAVRRDVL